MKNVIAEVPTIAAPIQPSPGFSKKCLADHKLDVLALCGFGCRYCSSNHGNYPRIRGKKFADLTEEQLGQRLLPKENPELMLVWSEVLDRLNHQLSKAGPSFGRGKTLVISMLTDGFSPYLLKEGITERALRMVLDMTEFRIRVLTKNATVGSRKWIKFFQRYPGRFVVGLSTGTLDDAWARLIEIGTSKPTARLQALRNLQDAGVPTYAMLCPVFPDVLDERLVEHLIDEVRPAQVEHVWAEPYNDRINWAPRAGWVRPRHVRPRVDDRGVRKRSQAPLEQVRHRPVPAHRPESPARGLAEQAPVPAVRTPDQRQGREAAREDEGHPSAGEAGPRSSAW